MVFHIIVPAEVGLKLEPLCSFKLHKLKCRDRPPMGSLAGAYRELLFLDGWN